MSWNYLAAHKAIGALGFAGIDLLIAEYWLSLWQGDNPPRLSKFDATKVREAIPGLSFFEVAMNGQVICRSAGPAYKFFFGYDITGQDWISLTPPNERTLRTERIQAIVNGAICSGQRRAPDRLPDQQWFTDITLPFAAESNGVRHFLVHANWRPNESELRLNRPRSPMRFTAEGFQAISIEVPALDLSAIQGPSPAHLDEEWCTRDQTPETEPIAASGKAATPPRFSGETVIVVDDDPAMLELISLQLMAAGLRIITFDSARRVLEGEWSGAAHCVISDIRMPDMSGLELQSELNRRRSRLPFIVVTAHGDIPLAVTAMRGGAADIIEKPFTSTRLLAAVERALRLRAHSDQAASNRATVFSRLELLTAREREVVRLLADGLQSKAVASALNISQRTVEVHRANIMRKLEVKTSGEIVRMVVAAEGAAPSDEAKLNGARFDGA
jgi:two-component system response regulator FixJ